MIEVNASFINIMITSFDASVWLSPLLCVFIIIAHHTLSLLKEKDSFSNQCYSLKSFNQN